MMDPDENMQRLIGWFLERGESGVVVAFSGGVDSTLVAVAAHEALKDQAMAITVKTAFMTSSEIKKAVTSANNLGIRHRTLWLNFPEGLRTNPPDRCYLCKSLILKRLKAYALRHGNAIVVDGTNFDDMHSPRPGLRALTEEGVASPLAELNLSKGDVRAISKRLGLEYNKPSNPCLATRFQTGHVIQERELEVVAKAEECIRGMGFTQVRVRVKDESAKIEVEREGVERIMERGMHNLVVAKLKRFGFKEVVIDPDGYIPEGERGI
jgi:uncharacterized protein